MARPESMPTANPGSAGTGGATPTPDSDAATANGESATSMPINLATREALIRRAAYILYERRGRVDGHAEEDWLRAEALIDRVLMAQLTRELFTKGPDATQQTPPGATQQMPSPERSS